MKMNVGNFLHIGNIIHFFCFHVKYLYTFAAMEQNELEMIQQTMQLFMKLGIKSVTMDDVARHLGISKKTLYKYVTDKNDLVTQVLDISCKADNAGVQAICDLGLNAIDESHEISKFIIDHIKTMHPSIIFDLQKYHFNAWCEFTSKKKEKINECYISNIEKGIKEGYYRDDINQEIIVKFYTGRFELMFDPELFPPERFNTADIYLEIFRYHIRGIASEKGIKYLEKIVQQEKLT